MQQPTPSSLQPRKQRYYRGNAPLHARHRFLSAHLAEALLVKYNRRSIPLVKGDTVKVVRGAYRGHEEKIVSVDHQIAKVTIEGVTITKADGTKKARPVDPSNLIITRLNLTDPLRRQRLTRGARVDEATKARLEKELEAEAKAQKAEIERFKQEIADREAKEKEKRRQEEGATEATVDPVTQKPIMAPKKEEGHEHAGGEHLHDVKEHAKEESKQDAKKEEK